MNSDEINLEEAFPRDDPVGDIKSPSVQTSVTERVIIPNAYPTELARKVRKQDFTDGTVRNVATLLQEILARKSGKRFHGISATQIGVDLQIMVVDVEVDASGVFSPLTFINPDVISYSRQAVVWSVNCFDTGCVNAEQRPLKLSAIARNIEGRTMLIRRIIPSTNGSQTQIRPHSFHGVSAQRFYHQWRHLGNHALEMCVVSRAHATDELLRLTRRDGSQE